MSSSTTIGRKRAISTDDGAAQGGGHNGAGGGGHLGFLMGFNPHSRDPNFVVTRDINVAVAALRTGRCTGIKCMGETPWPAAHRPGVRPWGNAEINRLAAALEAGGGAHLRALHLQVNRVDDAGAARLAATFAAGACPVLETLYLHDNRNDPADLVGDDGIGDDGAGALADVFAAGACPALKELMLEHNRVGDRAAARLAAMLASGGCPALRGLWLAINRVGASGYARLVAAVESGACPALKHVTLYGNARTGVDDAMCARLHAACHGSNSVHLAAPSVSGGKFWRATVIESTVYVTFGKINTKGQNAKPKEFPNAASAIAFFVKKAGEKRGKGYVDVAQPIGGGGGGGGGGHAGAFGDVAAAGAGAGAGSAATAPTPPPATKKQCTRGGRR